MAKRTSRGFSLIELLIAVALGGAGIAAASYVARMAVRGSARGSQVNQAVLSTQVIARQIKSDMQLAGFGSTGAVGADGVFPGQIMPLPRPASMGGAGRPALPVIRAFDNVPGGISIMGAPVLVGSDIFQVIVPDPSRATTNTTPVAAATTCTALGAATLVPGNLAGCNVVYVSDHTGATGAGRTQLMNCEAGGVDDPLLFDLPVGADVMCARWSTYWVDDFFQLHRSDYVPASGTVNIAGVLDVPSGFNPFDVIAPGVVDLQVAFRLSTEVPGVGSPATAWAYDGVSPTIIADTSWFEVRQARVNILFRTLRAVEDAQNGQTISAMENRPAGSLEATINALRPNNGTSRAYRFVRMTTSHVLSNQRFFDLNLPSGMPADPY